MIVKYFLHLNLILLSISSCSFSSKELVDSSGLPCRVPGLTIHWELDRCFLGSETDDEEHPLVQSCFDLAPHSGEPENCNRNLKLKRHICRYLINNNFFSGNLDECIDSDSTTGTIVRQGGISN